MQRIATSFEDSTFAYDQVERRGMIALYRQTHKASVIHRYEVVRVRIRPLHVWPNGQKTLAYEAYPSSRVWGRDGWTYHTLAAAQAHVQRLVAQASETPMGNDTCSGGT